MSVKVGDRELYTDHSNLQPLLFGAYAVGSTVEIRTESCSQGGGFAEVVFK
ncbi:Shiga-like toxin beta subunit [Burkholderia pseudomallei]